MSFLASCQSTEVGLQVGERASGDGAMGRWGDGAMGRASDGASKRWGEWAMIFFEVHPPLKGGRIGCSLIRQWIRQWVGNGWH